MIDAGEAAAQAEGQVSCGEVLTRLGFKHTPEPPAQGRCKQESAQ